MKTTGTLFKSMILLASIVLLTPVQPAGAQTLSTDNSQSSSAAATASAGAYAYLSIVVSSNRANFYVYKDADSGFNHSYPSGWYGATNKIHLNAGCIDDPNSSSGCYSDPCQLDRQRGTVLMVAFDAMAKGEYAGVNFEEPENWGSQPRGHGYDLRGATRVTFYARSPIKGGSSVQFGVNKHMSPYRNIPNTWTPITITFSSLGLSQSQLADVHILFAIATKDTNAPRGAVVLLDNIQFQPVPTSQTTRSGSLSFPTATQTFGEMPQSYPPFPMDQVIRNITTTYESSLTLIALLRRGTTGDLQNARIIADAFNYALFHDNHGDPLPQAPKNPNGCYDGTRADQCGLHNAYSNGDLALFNSQNQGGAQAGDVRLAGFTCGISITNYCLVLDGATGGNNAFAILALLAAYHKFGDSRYLEDAIAIGNWIFANFYDASSTGYGGYFAQYPDQGEIPKVLNLGKSVENNADIFAAFTQLAGIEGKLGHISQQYMWTTRANAAGDFVMKMFDSSAGRFYAGTVPVGTSPGLGVCPYGPRKGNDVINICDFLDADTFTTLAMASSARYRSQINWKLPVQYLPGHFAQRVTVGSQAFCGFDIVENPTSGPNGIAWEFTGQAVATSKFVDVTQPVSCSGEAPHSYLTEIALAQSLAAFGNGQGVVASTLQGGDKLCAADQCLDTPFQCIPERVGLAATTWAIFAEGGINIFLP